MSAHVLRTTICSLFSFKLNMSEYIRGFLHDTVLESQLSLQLTDYSQEWKDMEVREAQGAKSPSKGGLKMANKPGYQERFKQWAMRSGIPTVFFQTTLTLVFNLIATTLFIVTAWFSQATFASSTIGPLE